MDTCFMLAFVYIRSLTWQHTCFWLFGLMYDRAEQLIAFTLTSWHKIFEPDLTGHVICKQNRTRTECYVLSGSISIHTPQTSTALQPATRRSFLMTLWLLASSMMEMIGSTEDWQRTLWNWSLQNHLQINSGKTEELELQETIAFSTCTMYVCITHMWTYFFPADC